MFVEPNDQTMTASAASQPCEETRTQTLLGSGLNDAGSQCHRVVGTTLKCHSVGWSVKIEEVTGERSSHSPRHFSIAKPQGWRLRSSVERTLLEGL